MPDGMNSQRGIINQPKSLLNQGNLGQSTFSGWSTFRKFENSGGKLIFFFFI
jgi:hypothetical protein